MRKTRTTSSRSTDKFIVAPKDSSGSDPRNGTDEYRRLAKTSECAVSHQPTREVGDHSFDLPFASCTVDPTSEPAHTLVR